MGNSYMGLGLLVAGIYCLIGGLPPLVGGLIILRSARARKRWSTPHRRLIAAMTLKPAVTTPIFIWLLMHFGSAHEAVTAAISLSVLGPGVTLAILWRFRASLPAMPRLALGLLLCLDPLRWGSAYLGAVEGREWLRLALAMPAIYTAVAWLLAWVGTAKATRLRRLAPIWPLVIGALAAAGVVGGIGLAMEREFAARNALPGTSRQVLKRNEQIYGLAWSPDGSQLAAAGYADTVHIYSADLGDERLRFEAPYGRVDSVAWRPQGDIVAAQTSFSLHLFEAAGGREVRALQLRSTEGLDLSGSMVPGPGLPPARWSPDGRWLAVRSWQDGRIALVDPRSAPADRELFAPGGPVADLAWSPDSTLLATAGGDGAIRLWEAATGAERTAPSGLLLAADSPWLARLSWSANGRWLAAWNYAAPPLRVWSIPDLSPVELGNPEAAPVLSAAWRPAGLELAIAMQGGAIEIWSLNPNQPARVLPCRGDRVAWSAEGRWLAVIGASSEVCLWDAERSEHRSLTALRGTLLEIAWSPRGPALALGDSAGAVRVWEVER